MKTSSVLGVICFSLLALQLGGCKDDRKHHDGPIESHSGGTSDITGFVKLIDENGTVQTDNSGILVSADGTSHVSATDVNGKWTLAAMQTGTYSFTFSKSGYGTIKNGVQIIGGGNPIFSGTLGLHQVPTYTVINFRDTVIGSTVSLSGTFSTALPNYRNARIFIGKTPSVTANNPSSYSYTSLASTVTSDGSSFSFDAYTLAPYGIPSGTTVYAVAYSANENSYYNGVVFYLLSEGYTDPSTGYFVFTNLNPTPSNVVSFVTP